MMEIEQTPLETLIEIGCALELTGSEAARDARELMPQRRFAENWLRARGMTDAEVDLWREVFRNLHYNDGDFFGQYLYDVGADGLTDYERGNLDAFGVKYGVKTSRR